MARSADRWKNAADRTAVPKDVVHRLQQQRGQEVSGLLSALKDEPAVSIRVNEAKWNSPILEPVPWCATGHYLAARPSFTFDPLFHAGAYYVQEASSMLLEQAIKATGMHERPILALDLCAAPGGKSTHLRSSLHHDSLLVSNEVDRKRLSTLVENLWKWGAPNCVVTGSPPSHFSALPGTFDLIVVDAPCSGEGMFRKDPFALQQWSPDLVTQCTLLQRDILDHAWSSLRPRGYLIYSTCTWETSENEGQLQRFIEQGADAITIPIDPSWGVLPVEHNGVKGLRCYPHNVRGEGFFLAALRKANDVGASFAARSFGHTSMKDNEALNWLQDDRVWTALEHKGDLFAVDREHASMVALLTSVLSVASPGVPLAEFKGGIAQPHHALALSTALDRTHFSDVALDRGQALDHLRGAALKATNAQGTALGTFEDLGLGWLRGAGNRWNNRWPSAWRIRAQQPTAPLVSWASEDMDPA